MLRPCLPRAGGARPDRAIARHSQPGARDVWCARSNHTAGARPRSRARDSRSALLRHRGLWTLPDARAAGSAGEPDRIVYLRHVQWLTRSSSGSTAAIAKSGPSRTRRSCTSSATTSSSRDALRLRRRPMRRMQRALRRQRRAVLRHAALVGAGPRHHHRRRDRRFVRRGLHPVQQAFIDEQAIQCGYCIDGIIISAVALLQREKEPTDGEIASALDRNLCRCGTHVRIFRAIRAAARAMREQQSMTPCSFHRVLRPRRFSTAGSVSTPIARSACSAARSSSVRVSKRRSRRLPPTNWT